MPHCSPSARVGMAIPLLLHKVFLHLENLLSPLTFLRNLFLFSLSLKIFLAFASIPNLHTIITTSLQGFLLTFMETFRIDIFLFTVPHFIIFALFYTSKASSCTSKGASSSPFARSLTHHAFINVTPLHDNGDEDDSIYYDPLPITSTTSEGAYEFFDALAIFNDNIFSNELCIATNDMPSKELGNTATNDIPFDEPTNTTTTTSMELVACTPLSSMLSIQEDLASTEPQENLSQKALVRCKSDSKIMRDWNHDTKSYEYAQENTCSTMTLYTSSKLDSLSKEEANKHFSDFASRTWAKIKKESQVDSMASPLLSIST